MVDGLLPAKLPANWRDGQAIIIITEEELTDPGRELVSPNVSNHGDCHTIRSLAGSSVLERKVFIAAGLLPANLPAKVPANWREGPAIIITGEELTDPAGNRSRQTSAITGTAIFQRPAKRR